MCDRMMPFKHGVLGVLHGYWELELKTPLVIRNGSEPTSKAAFKQKPAKCAKGRGIEMAFAWKEAKERLNDGTKEWTEVTDFNYDFFVNKNDGLDVAYTIPSSAIRGVLRQWTIKSLVERRYRDLFQLPKIDEISDEYKTRIMEDVKEEIQMNKRGWRDILSLFGLAFNIDPENPLTWAGRLRINIDVPSGSSVYKPEAAGVPIEIFDGPQNIKRHINVRNPIDRVTMAAKDGGLHFGMEMSEGQQFSIDFHILNPKPIDVRLVMMWAQDIQDGFLRFGALTSQGRGRVELNEARETYRFFVSPASALYDNINGLGKPAPADALFEDFWSSAELTRSELSMIDFSLLENI